jgi:protein-L-isoaspartate(D-aspartate) O-methyltransferase
MGKVAGPDFGYLRDRMVEEQLIPRGISDPKVLEAFRKVARHAFAPAEFADSSYNDYPLPIGSGQTISQPYMVALMTECLRLTGAEKVLEIGTGSGYQTAILAEIAREVFSVERIQALSDRARRTIEDLGYVNCRIMVGDGTLGWEEYAPYDGIIVTAGAPRIPASLVKQLNNGGRLVIPIESGLGQTLTVIENREGFLRTREICGCVFVPLIGKEGWPDNAA